MVGILVVAAMLVLGTSTARAQTQLATCSYASGSGRLGSCSGGFPDSSFSFSGPFYTFEIGTVNQLEIGGPPPPIEFGVGTNGGAFTYNGIVCNYDVVLGGNSCDGDVLIAAQVFPPNDTGFAPGAVVSIVGPAMMKGFFCEPCSGSTPQVASANVTGTYQLTLTAPGTLAPWSWTGANFSSLPSTPEPSTLLLFGSGVLLLGIIFFRKH